MQVFAHTQLVLWVNGQGLELALGLSLIQSGCTSVYMSPASSPPSILYFIQYFPNSLPIQSVQKVEPHPGSIFLRQDWVCRVEKRWPSGWSTGSDGERGAGEDRKGVRTSCVVQRLGT